MKRDTKLVSYVVRDEVIVCLAKDEAAMLAEWFKDPEDRDVNDYDRAEHVNVACFSTRLVKES